MTSLMARMPSCTTYRELAEYRKMFNCLLCCEMFSDPQVLRCHHIFCELCLQTYQFIYKRIIRHDDEPTADHTTTTAMPCPTCRHVTPSTCGGDAASTTQDVAAVASLRNRKLSMANETSQRCDACVHRHKVEEADFYCSKCAMNFCNACKTTHEQHLLFRGHSVIHISNKDTFNLYCDAHAKQICAYFCADCDLPACAVCILQDHREHRATRLRDALAARRDALKTILNLLGPRLDRLEAKMRKLSVLSGVEVRKNGVVVICNGGGHGGGLANNGRSSSTLHVGGAPEDEDNDHQYMVKFLRLSRGGSQSDDGAGATAVPVELLTWFVARYRRLFEMSTKIVEPAQSKKLLAVYEDLVARAQTILDVELVNLQKYVEEQIVTREAEVQLVGRPLGYADIDSGSSIASSGRGRHSSGVSAASTTIPEFDGVDGADGRSGGCGGPTSMLVRPKLVWKVEKQRSDVGEMWNPCGAVFLPDDRLLVAEYDSTTDKNNKLRIFDRAGGSVAVLAQGQIQPLGVALTRDGHVAVTDCKGKRVRILTLNGQTIAEIGKGQFGWPYGIAVDSRGHLIVTDAFSDSVSVYHMDGKRIRQFGSSGSHATGFRNPYHVAVDARDNILVSDSGNNCVKAFDSSGRYLYTAAETSSVRRQSSVFDVAGACSAVSIAASAAVAAAADRKLRRRKLKGPRGLSVDQRGNLLVADDCGRVSMFDGEGQYVRNLLTEEDFVKYPEAVHCSPRGGLLAVTEWNPNNMFAVKVFSLYE